MFCFQNFSVSAGQMQLLQVELRDRNSQLWLKNHLTLPLISTHCIRYSFIQTDFITNTTIT